MGVAWGKGSNQFKAIKKLMKTHAEVSAPFYLVINIRLWMLNISPQGNKHYDGERKSALLTLLYQSLVANRDWPLLEF